MRYQVELPFTAAPVTSPSTFTRSPGTSPPTTGAPVVAAARTLACERIAPHQPEAASEPSGKTQFFAHSDVASRKVCRPTKPSVVDHHVPESPSMPGETPVTRTKSPCFAERLIGSLALGRAYIDTLGTLTSAIHGVISSTMSADALTPSGPCVHGEPSVPVSSLTTTTTCPRESGPTGADPRSGWLYSVVWSTTMRDCHGGSKRLASAGGASAASIKH